ncbi:outer membrane lipoprotein chaperone LolA [Alteromonas gracilis]|uniref:outer membrane lipoprotein chaperone LolA n=1 Tax=Alteromonas gracilis TaxID=1479524 RepID=UPI0037357F73
MNKAVSVYLVSAIAGVSMLGDSLHVANAAQNDAHNPNEATLVSFSDQDTNNLKKHEDNALADPSAEQDSSAAASASLQALLSNMKQFRAGFAQTVVDAQQNVVHEAQGTLTMTRPNKLRWETTFPDETLLVADGEAVWNVDTFVEQVTVLSQANAIKDNPIVLLTSTDEATWSSFSINKTKHASAAGNTISDSEERYQISPKEAGGQIVALTLTFNQENELTSLDMLDAQQQVSTLVFNNIETRFPVPADTFSVEIPDSFIIDDQR